MELHKQWQGDAEEQLRRILKDREAELQALRQENWQLREALRERDRQSVVKLRAGARG